MAGPAHGVAHALDLDLRLELEALPVGPSRQRELGLPDLPRQRIAGIEAAPDPERPVVVRHLDPKHAGHAGDTVVGEADHEAVAPAAVVVPDVRGPHAVA